MRATQCRDAAMPAVSDKRGAVRGVTAGAAPVAALDAAARALARGDPLAALRSVALYGDAPSLALRGTAMAQVGDYPRALRLLRAAARASALRDPLAHARCIVAAADVALAARDLRREPPGLVAAAMDLADRGDERNAAHARHLVVRWHLLSGRVDDAIRALAAEDTARLPPASRALHELLVGATCVRRGQAAAAATALRRAGAAARRAGIRALSAEVAVARRTLSAPVARVLGAGRDVPVSLAAVERLEQSTALVVDACRLTVRQGATRVALAGRPVLMKLARTLAVAWPGAASREELVRTAFRRRRVDDSLQARLRVEIGRLRRLLAPLAAIRATGGGFGLAPHGAGEVLVLALPVEEGHAAVLALLADGERWSSSALAVALDLSQRTIQRALDDLAAAGKVEASGRGRARRWVTALRGIPPALLLPPVARSPRIAG
jgi:hypothetical protein